MSLSIPHASAVACLLLFVAASPSRAADQRCTFQSPNAHMTAPWGSSDAGPLEFTWMRGTGGVPA